MITQWVRRTSAIVALILLGTGLAACIQDSGGIGGDLAGGGIGGTGNGGVGLGEITGFGSIRFNDDSTFETNEDTEFFIDGDPVENEDAFKGAFGITDDSDDPVGAVAIVEVRDVNAGFTDGTATRVDARTAIKGRVTGINPLQVLGQTVVVTGGTVLADLPGGIGNLSIDNEVEVSGFTEQNNNVLASRLQRKTDGLSEWKLTGFVTHSSAVNSFNVGGQVVSLDGGIVVRDCGNSIPQVGQFVEVKAVPDSGFSPGASLIASDVECKLRGLSGELDDSGVNLRRVQGFISSAIAEDVPIDNITFTIGGNDGQEIRLTANTVFSGGARADLGIGVRVEITGQFNAATGVLTASRVSFREARVRIEAPLFPGDLSSSSVTLLGIAVNRTALTKVDAKLLDQGNLPAAVRLRGYVDRDGTVYADEIDHRDNDPFDKDLRLRGPVDADSIFTDSRTFSILDVEIRPGSQTTYRDHVGRSSSSNSSNTSLSEAEFFARLIARNGHPVQVHGGSFIGPSAGGPAIVNPSEIEHED